MTSLPPKSLRSRRANRPRRGIDGWVAGVAVALALLAAIPPIALGGTPSRSSLHGDSGEVRTSNPTRLAACDVPGTCPEMPSVEPPAVTMAGGGYQANRTVGWSELGPPPLDFGAGGGMVANASAGIALTFGGENSGQLVNSTNVYTEATNAWSTVSTANAPSPRSDFAFALDPTSDSGILFGGLTNLSTLGVSNETWLYSVAAQTWTGVTHGPAPPAREGAAFAIDPALDIGVLYGGWNRSYSSTGSITYSDLWELDLSSFAWSEVVVAGSHPPPLEGAAALWDPSTLRFDMYGGCYPCSTAVWEFDPASARWSEFATPFNAPAARGEASWGYDPALSEDLLFGGTTGGLAFNDTYLFDAPNDTWVPQTLPSAPTPRFDAESAFLDVPGNQTWLVAGGESGSSSDSDIWRLSETSNVSLRIVNASSPLVPLNGAEVNLTGRNVGFSNGAGDLNLTQVDAVGQAFRVTLFGYYTWNGTIWLPPGRATNLTVSLVPEPPGTIYVMVLSAVGQPIAGGVVNLTVNGTRIGPAPNPTDAHGAASFHGVPPGRVGVVGSAPGWRPTRLDGVLLAGGELNETIVLIVPDPVLTVGVFGRFPSGTLLALSGVPVFLNGTRLGFTDPAGAVTAVTDALGFVSVTSSVPGYTSGFTVISIPFTGPVNTSLDLFSFAFASLFVNVLRLTNDLPIGNAVVLASSTTALPSGWFNESNETDELGIAGLSLPEGSYTLTAVAGGYVPSSGIFVPVLSGSTRGLTIHLAPLPVANAHFYVRDDGTGQPVAGANVSAPEGLAGTTDSAGFYNATGVSPGTYSVSVSAAGYLSNESALVLHPGDNRSLVVNLTRLPPPTGSGGLPLNVFPAGTNDFWPFLLAPLLLVVGAFIYASSLRSARRDAEAEATRSEFGTATDAPSGAPTSEPPGVRPRADRPDDI